MTMKSILTRLVLVWRRAPRRRNGATRCNWHTVATDKRAPAGYHQALAAVL